VITYEKHNDDLLELSSFALMARAGFSAIWSREAYREVKAIIREQRPDVVHFHNTFPQISPAAYYASKDAGIPVVQTVHNYRIGCINGMLFRDGSICGECLEHGALRGVIHGCYHNSRIRSLPLACGQYIHKWLATYARKVDVYIALTDFMKRQMVRVGLPAVRIVVKPNFVDIDLPSVAAGDYFVFVGRLEPMKGVQTLLDAVQNASFGKVVVVGDGELASVVKRQASQNFEYVGPQPLKKTMQWIAGAKAMIVPSLCYESFGRVVVEAFACGTPVIASDIGGLSEIVRDGETGFLFKPGDASALIDACTRMEDRGLVEELGRNARDCYRASFTPQKNYDQLIDIYRRAIDGRVE
jgi:glycosyltransferase involved in cell wall biosynthesis